MPDLVIALTLILAVVLGIVGNRWWGRRERSAEDGLRKEWSCSRPERRASNGPRN